MPADALIELAKNYEINLHWLLTGVGAGNPIDHCAQTGQFAAEVRTYLDAEKIKIGSKNFGNIITKWGTTLAGGKAATMPEVYIWVDLLKE